VPQTQPQDTTNINHTKNEKEDTSVVVNPTLSISEQNSINRVYAAGKNIYIQTEKINSNYYIYSLNGQLLDEGRVENNFYRINTSLPTGNYIVRVYSSKEFILNEKVFIQ
jgi:hypothetical protein